MKKTAALILSALFYIGAFMLTFIFSTEHNILYFSYILPLLVAAYFIIAGNIFAHRLGLNRWLLWLIMNVVGGMCSWILLLVCFPMLLFNGFILFFFVPVTVAFAVVWAVVWIGFLCIRLWKRRAGSAGDTGQPSFVRPKRTGAWKEKLTGIVRVVGVIGLVLAMAFLYTGVKGIVAVRPASGYEDMGVHTFSPYRVLPVSVENTSTGRDKRLNPTKTVYVVYYQTSDGSGYQWEVDTGSSKSEANQLLAAGESVERRVLSVKETGKYITVEAELTADTYVEGKKQRYLWMSGLSAGYMVLCLVSWVLMKQSQKKDNEKR